MSLAHTKAMIEKSKIIRENFEDEYDDEKKQLELLNTENVILRKELKTMNENLNQFIDMIKDYRMKKIGSNKARFEKKIDLEGKQKVDNQEFENQKKQYNNLQSHLDRLNQQMKAFEDPQNAMSYLIDFKDKLQETEEVNKTLEKKKRFLEDKQY